MSRKLKILMVETANMNLGDNVIADNNCRLLRYAMFPRDYELFHYNLACRDVEQIAYVDAVIFAGGIVKSTNEKFWQNIAEVLDKANEYDVPVFMSGIGAEPIQADEKGENLKRTLNLPCVKVISCRDDTACLKNDYLTDSAAEVIEVFDSALWSKQTYRAVLKNTEYPKDKKCIGIGIIRHKIFPDYGNAQITKEMQIAFWRDVVETVEQQGYRWKIFTNGDTNDEKFAEEMLSILGRGEKYPAPRNANALMRYINSFGGVVGGRMHSNIIAYTLGIPSVGLIWNKKLRFWGEKIGYPERFLEPDAMDGKRAAEILFSAMQKRCRPKLKQMLPSLKAYRHFVKYIKRRDMALAHVDLNALCAPGLGCIETRYKNTNSAQALAASLTGGFKTVMADVRITEEEMPVLVNRWHKATYKMLGFEPVRDTPEQPPLAAEAFLNARYFNRFEPLSLEAFLKKVNKKQALDNVILAFGRPGKDTFATIVKAFKQGTKGAKVQYIFLLERKMDVERFLARNVNAQIMFYYLGEEPFADTVGYCVENKIEYICLKFDDYTPEAQALCDKAGIKIAVPGANRTEKVLYALQGGAAIVGSEYYDVHYYERLLQDEKIH